MVVEAMEKMIKQIPKILEPEDIANAIVYATSQPEHVSINELLIRPTGSAR
jgi:NADP-dependent 3-hydroxy acid dehydrogenase YdfG